MISRRHRFSTHILLTFFVNVTVLVIAGTVFVHWQSLARLDYIFESVTQARLQEFASQVSNALVASRQEEIENTLETFSEQYGVRLGLFPEHGNVPIAGKFESLPEAIRKHLQPRRPAPPRAFPQEGPPRPNADRRPPPPRPRPRSDDNAPPPHSEGPFRIVLETELKTGERWAGIKIPAPSGHGQRNAALLLIQSPPGTSALFFDARPWGMAILIAIAGSIALWIPLILNYERRLKQLAATTDRIAAGELSARVKNDSSTKDEIGELGQSVNTMAQQLQRHVNGQKRFLGDIAHELASPVARMQAALGLLERHVENNGIHHLDRLDSQVQTMGQLINELMLFSKDRLTETPQLQSIELRSLIDNAIDRELPHEHTVVCSVASSIRVSCLPHLLERAIANVLRNSLRYAGSEARIEITTKFGSKNHVLLTIADDGPGVADSDLSRLFDAFYRPTEAREAETGGAGLGLAIVKSCIESCNGHVTARNQIPHGLAIHIDLLRAPSKTLLTSNHNGTEDGTSRGTT